MPVAHVAYEVDGWGVGELWLDEAGRVVWHELPRPAKTAPRGTHALVGLLDARDGWNYMATPITGLASK